MSRKLRANPAQRRALRLIQAGECRYDPATATLRRTEDGPTIQRATMDVLVARSWARWSPTDDRLAEITGVGAQVVQQMPRRPS